jgi:hypothetical protein
LGMFVPICGLLAQRLKSLGRLLASGAAERRAVAKFHGLL